MIGLLSLVCVVLQAHRSNCTSQTHVVHSCDEVWSSSTMLQETGHSSCASSGQDEAGHIMRKLSTLIANVGRDCDMSHACRCNAQNSRSRVAAKPHVCRFKQRLTFTGLEQINGQCMYAKSQLASHHSACCTPAVTLHDCLQWQQGRSCHQKSCFHCTCAVGMYQAWMLRSWLYGALSCRQASCRLSVRSICPCPFSEIFICLYSLI